MKVTAWTNEGYAREHYIDIDDERLKLLNRNKEVITPINLKILAKEYESILSEMQDCIINHCKEKGIRFSADYHQYGNYGVPIIDNKYMFFTFARTWGYIMAMADDDKSDSGYLKYYLYGNEHPIKYPNEVEGEIYV